MRPPARLVLQAVVSLALVPALHAEGLEDLTARYVREYARGLSTHRSIPSFSRQTGLACNACHTAFPHLTPLGRMFKLNGYTMTALQMVEAGDSGQRPSLRLDLIPPISAMVISSFTQTAKAQPGTQNGTVQFPQQLSLFFGEAITPRLGTFLQITYDPVAGGIGMDNADIRYANRTKVGGKSLLYGFTLNNNPTVQDVWNTVPAWGFPYATSAVAPSPAASVLLDGSLGQRAAGLGTYMLWDNHLYGEISLYRSSVQGGGALADSTAIGTIHGVGPYWRAYFHQQMGRQDLMIGTLGMSTSIFPKGVTGLRNRFTDIGFDAQYELPIGDGKGGFTTHAIWMHEKQSLAADLAAEAAEHPTNTLNTLRLDASVYTAGRLGFTMGYFSTSGTTDALRYPEGGIGGSAIGSPNSNGLIFQASALPWLNTRFEIQYVMYRKFNGANINYDGSGRNAKDNNTLYLMSWVAF